MYPTICTIPIDDIHTRTRRVEEIELEVQHLRGAEYNQYEPSDGRNGNGKRRMTDVHQYVLVP